MRPHFILIVGLLTWGLSSPAADHTYEQCKPLALEARDFPLSKLTPDAANEIAAALHVRPDEVIVRRLAIDPQRQHRLHNGFTEDLVDPIITLDIDAAPFLAYARDMAKEKEIRSCRLNVSTGMPRLSADNSDLSVAVPTTVESNICGSFTTICCHWLKCRKCLTHFRTKLFQKTVDVNLVLHPTLELASNNDPKPNLIPTASISGISGWENEVRKALNQILEIFTSKIDDTALGLGSIGQGEWLTTLRDNITALVHLSGGNKKIANLEAQLRLAGLAFVQTDERVVFRLIKKREEPMRRSAYCPGQHQIRETFAYLDSFRRKPMCVPVSRGEGFWQIADRNYANGDCGLALAQLHRRRTNSLRALKPGDVVLVPPMHQLLEPVEGAAIVGAHQTRFGIASDAGKGVEETFLEEKDRLNPDLIYPCQFVAVGDSSRLDKIVNDVTCPLALPPGPQENLR